ncbi:MULTISPECIES: hypothetical protein [Bizionia]|uniref:Uncharacterized protein n=1 Tax=Bizionia algoritergicola TaxID=291187 RepID=A0A5D0R3L7_9FLAO|nr:MULTISPECIES: hypothetical protein [Bizionia]TYB75639.1 hypothetical protein ES675_05830 [Bizionia algoritergicola]
MKHSILLLLALTLNSCSSDDNPVTNTEISETPILKKMHKERIYDGLTEDFDFNTSGRLQSFNKIVTDYYQNDRFIDYAYNSSNQLIEYKEFIESGATLTSSIQFSGDIPIRVGYNNTDNNVNFESIITINNSVLSFVVPDYEFFSAGDAEIIITFETNKLEKIIEYRINQLQAGNTTTYTLLNFEYDNQDNLLRYGIEFLYGFERNESFIFTYDNEVNPFAVSLKQNAIWLLLIEGHFRINIKNLILISPNNILIDNYHNKSYTYNYNIFDYPYSATISNLQSQQTIETLTFTYY